MKKYIISLINTRFSHGLFMCLGGSIMTALYTSVQNGHIPQSEMDIKPILIGGIGAVILYVAKNMGLGSGSPEIATSQQSNTK